MKPLIPTLAALVLAAAPARADGDPRTDGVPRMLPYQGVLELDGQPVEAAGDAALHLLFSLYDGPDAERPVYSQRLVVEVFTGRFTATIGPVGAGPDGEEVPIDAIIAAADDLHLGMTLLGDPDDPEDDVPLANRQRIHATPYAMWTTTATDLAVARHATVGGDLEVAGEARIGGGLRVTGPVELPPGSLRLDDIDAQAVGQGLARAGDALTVDDAYLDARIRGWVRAHCRVSLGWRDSCNGCGSTPAKHATVQADGTCTDASGQFSGCRGGTWGGVNTDGDVNNDDVFYVRFVCD